MSYEQEEKIWRRMLGEHHGCTSQYLYGDDGEMQCAKCFIDFRRCTPEQVQMQFNRIAGNTFAIFCDEQRLKGLDVFGAPLKVTNV